MTSENGMYHSLFWGLYPARWQSLHLQSGGKNGRIPPVLIEAHSRIEEDLTPCLTAAILIVARSLRCCASCLAAASTDSSANARWGGCFAPSPPVYFAQSNKQIVEKSKSLKKVLTKGAVGAKITPVPRMERAPCKLNNETLTSTR